MSRAIVGWVGVLLLTAGVTWLYWPAGLIVLGAILYIDANLGKR